MSDCRMVVETVGETTNNDDGSSTLESLSTDAMNLVLSFVTLSDYKNLSQCSKPMERAVSRASHLYMEETQASSSTTIRAVAKNKITNKDGLIRLLDHFDNLTCLQLDGNNLLAPIGDHLLTLLNAAPAARTLQSLALHGAVLTPLCHETLRLPHLKHLRLSGGSIRLDLAAMFGAESYSDDTFKNDENRIYDRDHMSSSSLSPFSLVEKSCSSSSSFTLPTSSSTLSSCTPSHSHSTPPPRLQSLYIAHCSSLRDKQLCELLHRVGGGNSYGTENMNRDEKDGLQSLSLHQCLRIKKPILKLPYLQYLSLFGCFALTQLPHFSCPQLLVLDLSYCFRLTSRRLDELLSSVLPSLQELILVKCPSLTDPLQIASSSLRLLNVSHCDAMTSIRLTCPQLETLQHDGCSSLHTLLLYQTTSLLEINASTLPALSRVEIMAPNAIQRLDLSNCKRLQSCSIQCPHLQHVNLTSSRTVALRFCKEVRWVWMQNWTRGSKLFMDGNNASDDDDDDDDEEENDDMIVGNRIRARTMATRTTPMPCP